MENSFSFDFTRGNIFVMIGKQGSGKSFLTKDLLRQFCEQGVFEFGVVFTSTSFNSEYNDFLPKGSVHDNYSEAKLDKYLSKLRNWMEETPGEKLPPSFLILDDLLGKIRLQSNIFSNLMATYRHYNLSIFLTSQYMVKNVSTLLRELTDYAFIFRTRFKNSLVSLYESFGQLLEDQDEFNEYLKQATEEKHACLLYIANAKNKEEAYISYKSNADNSEFHLDFIPVSF